jgi:putative transposase
MSRQFALLGLSRTGFYYSPKGANDRDKTLMDRIDEIYTDCPFYGSRKMQAVLNRERYAVGRRHVIRLMRKMALYAIYPGPKTSILNSDHRVYPYLLRGRKLFEIDEVWSCDITYIRLADGFVYLIAVIDWASRYVLSWSLSNTLDVDFCVTALRMALANGKPKIFNTDQGSQFTSCEFTSILLTSGVQISMDGRGRAQDNIFIERFWRTIKYELVYLNDFANMADAKRAIGQYIAFYNHQRLHQSLDYRTPAEVYSAKPSSNPERLGFTDTSFV